MTDPISQIVSSAVGTVVGAVAGFFQAKQEIAKRKMELDAEKVRLAHEEKMATINADIETQKDEGTAFAESQRAASAEKIDLMALPANAPGWATGLAIIANFLAIFGNFVRTITRPGITWYLVVAATYNPANAVAPLASTCVGWWFGQRHGARYFGK